MFFFVCSEFASSFSLFLFKPYSNCIFLFGSYQFVFKFFLLYVHINTMDKFYTVDNVFFWLLTTLFQYCFVSAYTNEVTVQRFSIIMSICF